MNVSQLLDEVEQRNKTTATLYNPENIELIVKHGDNHIFLAPGKGTVLPYADFIHAKKHLVDWIMNRRNINFRHEDRRLEIEKQVCP